MHELAIAQRLIETASALLPASAESVTRMRVQLGQLAGLSEAELRFGFDVVARNTPYASTQLEIEKVPAVIHCPHCGLEFGLDDSEVLLCPSCHSPAVVVIQGKDLTIASLDIQTSDPVSRVTEIVNG